MVNYQTEYEKLKLEYEGYQKNIEYRLQSLSSLNMYLEKNVNILANIVEISNYVNSFVSSENLMATINDMIIGILGVTHSVVYILEGHEFIIKASSVSGEIEFENEKCATLIQNRREFLLNSDKPIVICEENPIYSLMGIPIRVRDRFLGYIMVMHSLHNFFTEDHRVFLTSVASQVAIAIENSILYNKLQKSAETDPLIGIYNRKTFFNMVKGEIQKKPQNSYAIIMSDLDNFKSINDTLGHQFGDEVLIQTCGLISAFLDDEDIFARYGGEELIIFVPTKNLSREEVFNKVDEIREEIAQNIVRNDGISKSITTSIGVGLYPNDGQNLEEVIKVADRRLYNSKKLGKNRVSYKD